MPVQVVEILAPNVVGLLLGQAQHPLHLSHPKKYPVFGVLSTRIREDLASLIRIRNYRNGFGFC